MSPIYYNQGSTSRETSEDSRNHQERAYQYRNKPVIVIPLYALPGLIDQTDSTRERY